MHGVNLDRLSETGWARHDLQLKLCQESLAQKFMLRVDAKVAERDMQRMEVQNLVFKNKCQTVFFARAVDL